MFSRLSLVLALGLGAAAPVTAAGEAQDGFAAAFLGACLSDAAVPHACIGTWAEACMTISGRQDPTAAGPCFGDEAAFWQARLDRAMETLAEAGAAAEEFADRVDWPDPAPTMEHMAAAFEAHLGATCDMAAALRGGGSGAGPAWMECRMWVTAEQALRLERWEAWR